MSERFDVTVSESQMARFADLSGDRNPMHMDPAFARAAGFHDVVAFGLLTSSFYSRLVGMLLPGKFALLHGIDLDFKSPVFVGEPLCVIGEIKTLSEAYRRIEIAGKILRYADEKIVSKCLIRVGLHEH
jgi:3-hydroxybutyryl-CoA dehydratase